MGIELDLLGGGLIWLLILYFNNWKGKDFINHSNLNLCPASKNY